MSAGEIEAEGASSLDLRDLLGATAEAAIARFGLPAADRRAGGDRWLVFRNSAWSLRLRARPRRAGGPARVRSWTVAWPAGFDTLGDALRAIGLPGSSTVPDSGALRLPLPDGAGRLHSLTASRREGRIRSISGFDEPPDWEPR